MSEVYYKAVRPNGTDFRTGTVRWLPEDGVVPDGGWLVEHPSARRYRTDDAANYLSVSVVPTDCTGMAWPCRLLRVVPVGRVGTPNRETLPSKRCARAWRVVEELGAHLTLGPQGAYVAALLERVASLSASEMARLAAARDAAWAAAWAAAWEAARNAARDAAWEAAWEAARDAALAAAWDAAWAAARAAARAAAWDAARDAARGLLVRDLISAEHYDLLTGPWRRIIGPIHPDDHLTTGATS